MNVELRNIGIINHSDIDLSKDLLIFSGPNNTGKTYIAYSLYAIYKYTREFTKYQFMSSDTINNLLNAGVSTLLKEGKISLKIEEDTIDKLLDEVFEDIVEFLPNVFASEIRFFEKSKIGINISKNEVNALIKSLKIQSNFKFTGSLIIAVQKDQNSDEIDILVTVDTNSEQKKTSRIISQIEYILSDSITESILNHIFNNVYITPTERTAINLFSKELSVKRNEIVDRLLEYKTNKDQNNLLREVQRYPLPIRDSLAIAEDLSNLQKNKSNFGFIADIIEKDILKGKISISKEGDVLFNPAKSVIKNLNIHLSASVVKSLSNLVFYFKHLAKKKDFIIIDEPELNLHPDNQIIMARLIAVIVNNGFKVLISTHSDYIIRELNNLIRLNHGSENLKEEIKSKFNYSTDNLLDKNKVGVYLFRDKKSHNITVDELGFEIVTIEKENSLLAQMSEKIYFEIFENNAR